jgi:hypothetical protein
MIHAVGINMEKITKKIITYFLVGWKARGLPKGGFGCGLAIKAKKGEKKGRLEGAALPKHDCQYLAKIEKIGKSFGKLQASKINSLCQNL